MTMHNEFQGMIVDSTLQHSDGSKLPETLDVRTRGTEHYTQH